MNIDKVSMNQNTFMGKNFRILFNKNNVVKNVKKAPITEYEIQMNERLRKIEKDFASRAQKSWVKAKGMFFNV